MSTLQQFRPRTLAAIDDDPSLSLFDRIGGVTRVGWIVDRLYERLWADRALADALADVDLASLKRAQTHFFARAFGGPSLNVDSDDLSIVLGPDEFGRVAVHLWNTLLSLDVPPDVLEELVVAIVKGAIQE